MNSIKVQVQDLRYGMLIEDHGRRYRIEAIKPIDWLFPDLYTMNLTKFVPQSNPHAQTGVMVNIPRNTLFEVIT